MVCKLEPTKWIRVLSDLHMLVALGIVHPREKGMLGDLSNNIGQRGQRKGGISTEQIYRLHRQNQTGFGGFHRQSVHNSRRRVNADPSQPLYATFLQTLQNGRSDKVLKIIAATVVLKIHGRGNYRIKGPPLVFTHIVPEKRRDTHTPMNPRSNYIITPNPGHERVPLMCKLVQVATDETIWVTQTQTGKVRPRRARKNVGRRRKTVQRRRRRRNASQVYPGRRKNLLHHRRRVKVLNKNLFPLITATKIEREVLKEGRKRPT